MKPPRETASCQWHEKVVGGMMNSAKTLSTAGGGELSLINKDRERRTANLESNCAGVFGEPPAGLWQR